MKKILFSLIALILSLQLYSQGIALEDSLVPGVVGKSVTHGRHVNLTATGFDGNLDGTIINIQKLADALDALDLGSMSGGVSAADVSVVNDLLNGLLSSSGNVQEALNRIDATGIGADIIEFTGSFSARDSNLDDWFRSRQNVVMEHTTGGLNQIRTFTLPDIDALNAMFDVLQSRNVGQVFTITIGYLGGSSQFINRNGLRIQNPSVSALFDVSEIPVTIAQGSSATFRIDRVGGSIGQWQRVSVQESPGSVDTFGDLEFQSAGWSNRDVSFLPSGSNVQKGYAFRVFNSDPNDGSLRQGLIDAGVTDKVIYNDDWVVWVADAFTSWTDKDNWFVLSADDVRRITAIAANFLEHVNESDARVDVGFVNIPNFNARGLIWLSSVVMQNAPFLDPNTDSNNPRSNADGERYIGGSFNVNSDGVFQFGANRFNNYMYVGISPNFVINEGAENIDILVRDLDDNVIQRLNLDSDFTLLNNSDFTNSTVNHYIYNTTGDPNSATSFNYGSLMTVGVVLTRVDRSFSFDVNVDVTPNVFNLQESQLSDNLRGLLGRIGQVAPDTDFSSILDRISDYKDVSISEPYVNARFKAVPGDGSFTGGVSSMTPVSTDNPRFVAPFASVDYFVAVEGAQNLHYSLNNITKGSGLPLDNSSPDVSVIASAAFQGSTYFIYRVSGIDLNDVIEIDRVTFSEVVRWPDDIRINRESIQRIDTELGHAVLDLPDNVVDILSNETSVDEQDNSVVVASDYNKSFSSDLSQAIFYDRNDPAGGVLSSSSIKDNSGNDRYRNKLVYLPVGLSLNDGSVLQYYDGAVNSVDAINYFNGEFFANVFVAAQPAGSATSTIYPAPSNRVSGAGFWQTIEALTFENGIPVPEANELFFTRNIPGVSSDLSVQYRGHANGNLFGASSTTLSGVGGSGQVATSFVLDDGNESATVEVRYYPDFNGSRAIRVSVTERVSAGLPTINDIQVILSYNETRVVPAVPETVRSVSLGDYANNTAKVFAIKPSVDGNVVIVSDFAEVDTKYPYATVFGSSEDGGLNTSIVSSVFFDYRVLNPFSILVQQLENHSGLSNFGLFNVEYDHETVLSFDVGLEINGVVFYGALTTVQRDALPIDKPAIIYNITDKEFNFLESGVWVNRNN